MFAKTLQNTGLTPPEVCKFANFYGGRGPKTEVEEHPSVSRETSFLTPEIRTFFSEDCLSKTWTLRSAVGLPRAIREKLLAISTACAPLASIAHGAPRVRGTRPGKRARRVADDASRLVITSARACDHNARMTCARIRSPGPAHGAHAVRGARPG
jgi:hypothetical protein